MKKILFAALAVLAFSSCAEDVVTDVQTYAIEFASNAQGTVKSTEVTTSNLPSFQVFAYNGENVIMDSDGNKGMTVTKSGDNAWTYSPKKYWPAEGDVDFFALYVENLAVTNTKYQSQYSANADSGIMFNISMADHDEADDKYLVKAADVPDAVYATAINKTKADGAVQMTFRHAMAQVDFQIKNSLTQSDIVVASGDVYVDDLYASGDYLTPTDKSTSDAGTGSWSFTDCEKAKYLFKTDGINVASAVTSGTILASKSFVFPQKAENVTFHVNCTIKQNNVVIFSGEKTATVNIDWSEGYKYTYTLLFNDSNIESSEIKLTASVTPFVTNSPVVIPVN